MWLGVVVIVWQGDEECAILSSNVNGELFAIFDLSVGSQAGSLAAPFTLARFVLEGIAEFEGLFCRYALRELHVERGIERVELNGERVVVCCDKLDGFTFLGVLHEGVCLRTERALKAAVCRELEFLRSRTNRISD